MSNKVGRPRNIKDPEELWELFLKYKEDTKATPRFKVETTPRGQLIQVPLEVPLTMVGFYNYCYQRVGNVYQYFEQKDVYSEFLAICRAIRSQVEQDQIEGGMVNIYNPSITQRLNGLSDKREVEVVQLPSPIIKLADTGGATET